MVSGVSVGVGAGKAGAAPRHNQTLISLQELRTLLTLQLQSDFRAIIIILFLTPHESFQSTEEFQESMQALTMKVLLVLFRLCYWVLMCNWSSSYFPVGRAEGLLAGKLEGRLIKVGTNLIHNLSLYLI